MTLLALLMLTAVVSGLGHLVHVGTLSAWHDIDHRHDGEVPTWPTE